MENKYYWKKDLGDNNLDKLKMWFSKVIHDMKNVDIDNNKTIDILFFNDDGSYWLCEDDDPLSIQYEALFDQRLDRSNDMLDRSMDYRILSYLKNKELKLDFKSHNDYRKKLKSLIFGACVVIHTK